jgi:tetratricopeptide (TPR) repeat protein
MFRRGGITIYLVLFLVAASCGPSLAADQCSLELLEASPTRAAEVCTAVLNADGTTTAAQVEALKLRGRAMQRMDRYPDAIVDYETGLRLAPNDAELHLRRGWTAYEELRRGVSASGQIYASAAVQPAFELALHQAKEALKLDPGYAEAYQLTAATLAFGGPDMFAQTKAAQDQAVRLRPAIPDFRFGRLLLLIKYRQFSAAIEDADAILRLPADAITKPAATESWMKMTTYRVATAMRRAELLEVVGRTKDAWQAYDQAVELDPHPVTYARRAAFRLSQISFFPGMPAPPLDPVQADVEKALALDPDYWVGHEQQGHVLFIRGQYDAAARELALALKQFPENGGMRWYYALTLRKLGRNEEAAGEIITAFRLDRGFMFEKLGMLRKLGYLAAIAPDADPRPALMDAARACMLDEKCG